MCGKGLKDVEKVVPPIGGGAALLRPTAELHPSR